MRKLRLREAKICPGSHSQWIAERRFESIFPFNIALPFMVKTIIPWMICYVNVHPHIGSCISLPWYLVPAWSLGSVEAWPAFRTDQGQCQRVAGPGVSSPWAEEALVESAPPSVSHPAGLIRAFQPHRVCLRPLLVDPALKVLEEQSLMGSIPALPRPRCVRPTQEWVSLCLRFCHLWAHS